MTIGAVRSVDVGCVRLTERCLPDDPPTAEQRLLVDHAVPDRLAHAAHLALAALVDRELEHARPELDVGAAPRADVDEAQEFRILIGHALPAANVLERAQNRFDRPRPLGL